MKHTPTPWESAFQYIRTGPDSHGDKVVYTLSSLGNLGDFASVKMTFNDTAHIVRCVNAHEALTALIREAIELMPLGTAKRAEWVSRASTILADINKP